MPLADKGGAAGARHAFTTSFPQFTTGFTHFTTCPQHAKALAEKAELLAPATPLPTLIKVQALLLLAFFF